MAEDAATILLQYLTTGEENIISVSKRVETTIENQIRVVKELGQALGAEDKQIEKIISRMESFQNAISICNKSIKDQDRETRAANQALTDLEHSYIKIAQAEQQVANKNITMAGGFDWLTGKKSGKSAAESGRAIADAFKEIDREAARTAKSLTVLRQEESLSATALGRFSIALAGSADRLKQMETNAYNASRMSTLFSRELATHPIATMKAFAASTEKAAIASSYFKEQLAFIAASRFGSIIIWGSIFTGIATAVKNTVANLAELDVEVHRVASAFAYSKDSLNVFDSIQTSLLNGAREFGQTYKDIGTILWELKSAGLSASATFAGLETNQRLVVAGVSDINNATRLTAGLFRAYGDSLKGVTGDMEKFQRIGDVLAYTLNQSQIDLDGLVQGYKFASSTAELTGLSFEDLSAVLAVLNNRMLYGTTAGTSLVNAFIQLSKNWQKVIDTFNVKIDPTKSAASQMMSVIKQLHDRFGETDLSLQQLSDLFDQFNVRGGRAIAALIKGYPELIKMQGELADGMGKVNGSLKEIADTKLDTLSGQWKRFTENVKASAVEMSGSILFLKDAFRGLSDFLELNNRMSQIVSASGKNFIVAEIEAVKFRATLARLTGDWETLLDITRKYPDALTRAFEVGPKFFEGITTAEQLEAALKIATPLSEEIKKSATYLGSLNEEAGNMSAKFDQANKILDETRIRLQSLKVQDIIDIEQIKRAGSEISKIGDVYTNIQGKMQEFVNINGIWKSGLSDVKSQLGGITAELALAKANTPAAEIQKTLGLYFESADALDKINEKLYTSEKDINKIEAAQKEWGKRAEAVYKLYADFDKIIKKTEKSQDELNKRTTEHLNIMMKYGNLSKYDQTRLLDQQREAAEWAVLRASKAEDELKAREKLNTVLNAYVTAGVSDKRITDQIVTNSEQMLSLQTNITSELENQSELAKDALFGDDAVRAIQDIEEKLKGLPQVMKETKDETAATSEAMKEIGATTEKIVKETMPLWISQFETIKEKASELNTKVLTGFGGGFKSEDLLRGEQ